MGIVNIDPEINITILFHNYKDIFISYRYLKQRIFSNHSTIKIMTIFRNLCALPSMGVCHTETEVLSLPCAINTAILGVNMPFSGIQMSPIGTLQTTHVANKLANGQIIASCF